MSRKKKKKNQNTAARTSRPPESSYLKITAILASVFAIGLFIKVAFFQQSDPLYLAGSDPSSQKLNSSIEYRVQQVAANFKCACGGCGELPLDECTCDMPRGAKEEKNYIRNKLRDGLTVDQVVQLVNDKYGHLVG